MDELKPCPFCGGEAEMLMRRKASGGKYDSRVRCVKCGASSGVILASPAYRSDMLAAEAWNRRDDNG